MGKFHTGLLVASASLAIAGCNKPAQDAAAKDSAKVEAPAADAAAPVADAADATTAVDANGNPINPAASATSDTVDPNGNPINP